MKTSIRCALMLALLALAPALPASEKLEFTADEASVIAQLKALQVEIGPEKREFMKAQLELTPAEEAKFWPIYDRHQAALQELNRRRVENVLAYSRVWNAGHIEDVPADKLLKEAIAIERAEADLLDRSYQELRGKLIAVKLVRYLQLESKLRAFVRVKQASEVPLAE
jgi:Spy/CpxP family protein refolding chaperone